MERTQSRPLVTGRHRAPPRARLRRSSLEVVAFAVLWWGANLLSAVLALSATAFYVRRLHDLAEAHEPPEHRHRRRRRRRAGARRLGGGHRRRSAGRRSCCSSAMFFWTPPHFWALAIRYADDYRAADVPMLPAVVPLAEAARQMIGYTVAARRCRHWCWSRSPISAGSTASPRSCSAPVFLGATIGLGTAPDPAGEHAGVHLLASPT